MLETREGGCHCGRVRFRAEVDLDLLSHCSCSVCTKKGFLHLIVPLNQFEVVRGADALTTYQFNTGTAKHWFCASCGMHPFYVPRSDPDKIDVNARCLEGIDPSRLRVSCFDGQNWDDAFRSRASQRARARPSSPSRTRPAASSTRAGSTWRPRSRGPTRSIAIPSTQGATPW